MIIVKAGDPYMVNHPYTGKCVRCTCEFDVTSEEIDYTLCDLQNKLYLHSCPCCGYIIVLEKK